MILADPVLAAFGPWLRSERERLGLSWAGLAGLLDVDKSHVGHMQAGRSFPTMGGLPRLARALGYASLSAMFAGVEAYAAAPGSAGHGHTEDHRASPASPQEPAVRKDERPWLIHIVFPHQTAGTETGDSLSPGITRVEDHTA